MAHKYINFDLNDPRSSRLAEVLGNKTAKAMLSLLAESELSESEVASKLRLPASTVSYNMKKLVDAGLIEQVSSLFSSRGKKIAVYKVVNKSIMISPRNLTRGIIPTVLISGLVAAGIAFVSRTQQVEVPMVLKTTDAASVAASSASSASAPSAGSSVVAPVSEIVNSVNVPGSSQLSDFLMGAPNSWAWFLIGAMTALVIYMVWTWERKR